MGRFNTQYDRVTPFTYERNLGPSETLPDETLTIPEILSKYIRGQRVDGSFPSGFETPEEGVDVPFDELYEDYQEPATQPATQPAIQPVTQPAEGQKVDD